MASRPWSASCGARSARATAVVPSSARTGARPRLRGSTRVPGSSSSEWTSPGSSRRSAWRSTVDLASARLARVSPLWPTLPAYGGGSFYGGRVERSPLVLAALASAAVPGLDPASVEALPSRPGQQFDVAFIQDSQHRRWVIRAPRTPAAGAQMDLAVGLLGLLGRRVPFALPTPRGFAALKGGGRAMVYPYLPGQNLDFAALPPGPGLAAELGRTIAALHNTEHELFEEAGVPTYDAEAYRARRLADLDRAAATGHVPTGLLSRWER